MNEKSEIFSSPDFGSIYIIGNKEIRAGSFGTWEFDYIVGKKSIPPGGGIEIVFNTSYPTNTWSIPQIYDKTAPGYVRAVLSGAGKLSVRVFSVPERLQPYSLGCHIIQCILEDATLFERDFIRIIYGDTSYGSWGAQAQFMAREVEFPAYVDTEGKNNKILNRASWFRVICRLAPVRKVATFLPKIKVIGAQAKFLKVKTPMAIRKNEKFNLRVVACDAHPNRATEYNGTIRIDLLNGVGKGLPLHYTFTEKDNAAHEFKDLSIAETGIKYISVIDAANKIAGISNPIKVVSDEVRENIFWGEIHAHTELSDGNGTIDEHYEHAREIACLDFAGTVDHINFGEGEFGKEKWEITKRKAKQYNDPPNFVTIPGYEPGIRTSDGNHAHMNIYCESEDVPLIPTKNSDNLWELTKRYNLLLIPHHTGYSSENLKLTDWKIFKEGFTPVVEIYSAHGCSEYYSNPRALVDQNPGSFYQDALKKGYKLGVIASSDYHQAFLGQDIKLQEYPGNLNCRHFQYRTGYTAVIAKELSRKAIFDALRSRHCYATTGERIYLNFQINGHSMGSELKITELEKINISVEVAGANKLEVIEIVKDNFIFYSCTAKGEMTKAFQCTDEDLNGGISYYYVRVKQIDGEMAWSSPIWVRKEK